MELYIDNSNLAELIGLQDAVTEEYINDATVTVTLYDYFSDAPLVGEIWPLTLPYVAASNGNYRATLDAALALTGIRTVRAVVTADAGGGTLGVWKPIVPVLERRES